MSINHINPETPNQVDIDQPDPDHFGVAFDTATNEAPAIVQSISKTDDTPGLFELDEPTPAMADETDGAPSLFEVGEPTPVIAETTTTPAEPPKPIRTRKAPRPLPIEAVTAVIANKKGFARFQKIGAAVIAAVAAGGALFGIFGNQGNKAVSTGPAAVTSSSSDTAPSSTPAGLPTETTGVIAITSAEAPAATYESGPMRSTSGLGLLKAYGQRLEGVWNSPTIAVRDGYITDITGVADPEHSTEPDVLALISQGEQTAAIRAKDPSYLQTIVFDTTGNWDLTDPQLADFIIYETANHFFTIDISGQLSKPMFFGEEQEKLPFIRQGDGWIFDIHNFTLPNKYADPYLPGAYLATETSPTSAATHVPSPTTSPEAPATTSSAAAITETPTTAIEKLPGTIEGSQVDAFITSTEAHMFGLFKQAKPGELVVLPSKTPGYTTVTMTVKPQSNFDPGHNGASATSTEVITIEGLGSGTDIATVTSMDVAVSYSATGAYDDNQFAFTAKRAASLTGPWEIAVFYSKQVPAGTTPGGQDSWTTNQEFKAQLATPDRPSIQHITPDNVSKIGGQLAVVLDMAKAGGAATYAPPIVP